MTPEDVGEAVNGVALLTLSGWRASGLGTIAASPLKDLQRAERAVERLGKHQCAGHQAYSRFVRFGDDCREQFRARTGGRCCRSKTRRHLSELCL